MSDTELKDLQTEIANAQSTILNLRAHSDNLLKEAAEEEKRLAALQARLPKK